MIYYYFGREHDADEHGQRRHESHQITWQHPAERSLTEGCILLIVHDMSVVFGLADRISALVCGQIIASGTPEEIRGNPKVREAYPGEEAA